MQHGRLVRGVLCVSAVLLITSVTVPAKNANTTTIADETELAGMSFVLNQYCDTQSNNGVKNPEAVVAFAASSDTGRELTQDEINSIESGIVDNSAPTPEPQVSTEAAIVATPQPETVDAPAATPEPTVKPKSEYDDIGISVAEEYVNVRKKPTTNSDVVGKLYRGSAAKIVRYVGDWVQIRSGRVDGYIKKEFLAIGYSAERLIDQFGTKWCVVNTQTLKVREKESTDCTILTLVPQGESYEVLHEGSEWVKIEVDGTTKGYVSKQYVKMTVRFKKAVSIEEEQAEARRKAAAAAAAAEEQQQKQQAQQQEQQQKQQAQQQKQQEQQKQQSSKKKSSSSSKKRSSSTKKSSSSSSSNSSKSKAKITQDNSSSDSSGGSVSGSGNGSSIANYALKFVGNPYVYGGTSLTNGTDCSGFTQSIFRRFGISLPRTSRSQSGVGTKISPSSARAGDLIFYSSGGRVNHVALCIGGGRVCHASNPSVGITTSNMFYRTPYCARRVL